MGVRRFSRARYQRFLGAGLHLSQLSHFRGPAQSSQPHGHSPAATAYREDVMPSIYTSLPSDLSPETRAIIERVQPFTMTSPERIAALCNAVEYVVRAEIEGDFVECGVWRGGSSMAAALTFLRLGRADINLHLFDTFEGMTHPTGADWAIATAETAASLLARSEKETSDVWAVASLHEVETNLALILYPREKIHLIAGRIETHYRNGPQSKSVFCVSIPTGRVDTARTDPPVSETICWRCIDRRRLRSLGRCSEGGR